MYNSQAVYERIVLLSKCKNISISQINKECGINKSTLSTAAKSNDGMKAKNLHNVAECLDCSVDYLLGRTDNQNSHKDQSSNTVNGNYNAVDNSSVTVTASPLNEHQKALLDIYNKLSPIQQAQLLVEADKMAEK